MALEGIHTGEQSHPRRLLLYGVPGIGKSTFAAGSPDPIFIPTEDGLGDIAGPARFPVADSIAKVVAYLHSLGSEEHEYKTAVIDSIDWLERFAQQQVCNEFGKAAIRDVEGGFGKGESKATALLMPVLDALTALRHYRGMNVILVAHARSESFADPEHDPYDRYVPKIHRTLRDVLVEWCDEVLFAGYKTFTAEADVGFGRKRTRGIGGNERILRCNAKPAAIAKNRLGLPDEIPLDWNAYYSAWPASQKQATDTSLTLMTEDDENGSN